MSRIDDLVAEFCPDGVEFRPIEDLFTLRNGYTPSKSDSSFWEDGGIPWFRMEDIRANGRILDDSLQKITPSAVKGGRLFPANSLLVATSATIGEHALVRVPHLSNQRFTSLTLKQEWEGKIDMMFAFYYGFCLSNWCQANVTTSSFASVDMAGFRKFRFPVPPMEVQREIVRILDTFSALEAELEAELEKRRIQYAHYRDTLVAFGDGDVMQRFGDVATISRGASPRPIRSFLTDSEDGIPWIKIGDVPSGGKFITSTADRVTSDGAAMSKRVYPGDFVLSNSMSFGRPYITKIEGCIHDGWLSISGFEESFVPDFLYHLLRSATVQTEFARRAGSSTVQNLNADIVKSIRIPVPPLAKQQRIVHVLDSFDALVNDLSVGLPAELAARRTQYEHYRDRLLTFEERV